MDASGSTACSNRHREFELHRGAEVWYISSAWLSGAQVNRVFGRYEVAECLQKSEAEDHMTYGVAI